MRLPPLLPLQRQRPGSFALLMAATCVLMLLAAGMALALHAAAHGIATANSEHMLVQIADADANRRGAMAEEAMARLNRVPGVLSSHQIPDREARALVAPYIAGMRAEDLPLPIMIELRTRDRAAVVGALRGLPDVIVSTGAELDRLAHLVAALRAVALGASVAAGVATGLIAMVSARAALARERATLGVLHALGATDRQLSRLVTGKIARDAAIGVTIGFAAATLVIVLVTARLAAVGLGVAASLPASAWVIFLGLALTLIALAAAAAQLALLATLRRAP